MTVHYNVPMDAYGAHDGYNWSRIKKVLRARKLFNLDVNEESDALLFGGAFHTRVLEPLRWDLRHVVWEGGQRRGKAWEAFEAEALASKRTVVTRDDADAIEAMAEAVWAEAPEFFEVPAEEGGGKPDVELMLTETVAGRLLKCRLDILHPQLGIVDLKSAADAEPEAFDASAYRYGYHGQAAWYVDLAAAVFEVPAEDIPFTFVVVEKKPPYLVSVREVPQDVLAEGRRMYQEALVRILECEKSGVWPGYGRTPLQLPRWARRNNNNGETWRW